MPFQGNPRAGAPSTSPVEVLNLLFQQKTQREKMAFQQQQAAMAAQRQAEIDAAEEARKQEIHRLDVANKAFELMNKSKEQEAEIGAAQANAAQVKEQTAQAYPFVSTPGRSAVGPSGGAASEFGALPDQAIQNAYIQQRVGQQVDEPVNARLAALASVIGGISPQMQQYAETLPMQGANAEFTRQRLGQEETQKAIDTEARSNTEADRRRGIEFQNTRTLAKEANERAKVLGLDKTDARNREILRLDRVVKDPKASPEDRALAELNRDEFVRQKEQESLAAVPGEAVSEARDRRKAINEYNTRFRVVDMQESLLKFSQLTGGRNLGVQADVTSWLSNFRGIIEDATKLPFVDVYARSVREELNRTTDPRLRDRIEKEFLSQGVLDRISQGNITQQDASWLIARTNNPSGRITNAMMDRFQNPTKFMGFISSELAESQLRRNVATSRAGLNDMRNEIESAWPGRVKFDAKTGKWLPITRLDAADDRLYDLSNDQNTLDRINPTPSTDPQINKSDLLDWADQQEANP